MRKTLLPVRRVGLSVLLVSLSVLGGATAAPSPQDSSIFVGRPVPVVNVRRMPRRRRRRAPNSAPVVRVPLLALQLRLYQVKEDGTQVESSPQSQFCPGDHLRLGVTANQTGYLTIIHQPELDDDGEILFPASRLNSGGNYIAANREFVVPSNCPAGIAAVDCAYVVPQKSGRDLFTFVFSRDSIIDLPENATTATGRIQAQFVKQLEADSAQKIITTSGTRAGRYAVLVVNENRQDNEEIIKRFAIIIGNCTGSGSPQGSPVPVETPAVTPSVGVPSEQTTPERPLNDNANAIVTVSPQAHEPNSSSLVLIILGVLGGVGVLLALLYTLGVFGRFGRPGG